MRFLAALIALMIAAQPVQAGFCAMDMAGEQGAQAMLGLSHEGMDTAHDCCPEPTPDPGKGCPGANHCGACLAAHFAVPVASASIRAPDFYVHFPKAEPGLPPSHSAPPFRPPISLS